jgi:integrase/recombinase XerD
LKVRIYIRVRLSDGTHPFLEPAQAGNKRLRPLYALVDGKARHCPEGVYYLRYVRNGKRVWERVGTDPNAAVTAAKKRELYGWDSTAIAEPVASETRAAGRDLSEAATEYLDEVKAAKSRKTFIAYRRAVNGFVEACKSSTIEGVSRQDVLAYIGALRESGVAPRTISNRTTYVKTFLLHFGVVWPLLKTDRVRYTEKTVEAYSTDDLQRLFAAADQDETDLFQFLLCTGVREQEAMYATWADVDFARKRYKVSEKLALGFTPKDKEEGSIPIPDALVSLLQARRKRYPGERRIFAGPGGKEDGHFLRRLQRLAHRAALNCGECYSRKGKCCADAPMCHRWGLHRFRKTFATMHHEAGVPVRTIQRWLRHSSLDTTLRYLAGSDDTSEKTRAQVNSTFSGLSQVAQKEVA